MKNSCRVKHTGPSSYDMVMKKTGTKLASSSSCVRIWRTQNLCFAANCMASVARGLAAVA